MDPKVARLIERIATVVVGKTHAVKLALTALFARGHVLIEDPPGLGKTLLARTLAASIAGQFKRLQFTPDMLPADVTGMSVWNPRDNGFEFVRGPVFTQVLLADEINRTSPRTQSALLEAMEEHQVTIDGSSLRLPEPFFVIATQNPIELAGTYPLPEAQLDRFLVRIELGYPDTKEEIRILELHGHDDPERRLVPSLSVADVLELQNTARSIHASNVIHRYIVSIAEATRRHDDVRLGLSPRGSLALLKAAQAWAMLEGDEAVTPDAVKNVAPAVIGHRLLVDLERSITSRGSSAIVREILDQVPVPVDHHGLTAQLPR